MKKFMRLFLLCWLAFGIVVSPNITVARTQKSNSADLSDALSRLKNNPRYEGRILGTHLRRSGKDYVYEVRILRPDDSVIVVFISSKTGGVIGDSERNQEKPSNAKNKKNRKKRK